MKGVNTINKEEGVRLSHEPHYKKGKRGRGQIIEVSTYLNILRNYDNRRSYTTVHHRYM